MLDDDRWPMPAGAGEIGDTTIIRSPTQIDEKGITQITLDNGYENEQYEPMRGEVRWFRDELGQLWVKFYTDHGSEGVMCQVWPAHKVTVVEYDKPATIST